MNFELRSIENAKIRLEEIEDKLQENQKSLSEGTLGTQQELIKESIQVIERAKEELGKLERNL
ncbi:MAG: hypothetical protein GX308_08185 [Epulopiscium sp.]|nr:hypothetical protein [Candidatus Epulonipiscium sp.]